MNKPARATGLKIASRRPVRAKRRMEEEEEFLRRKQAARRKPSSSKGGVSRKKAPAFPRAGSRGSGKAKY